MGFYVALLGDLPLAGGAARAGLSSGHSGDPSHLLERHQVGGGSDHQADDIARDHRFLIGGDSEDAHARLVRRKLVGLVAVA